jgi:alpha-tubulin suppressor-like RCC1 family protein
MFRARILVSAAVACIAVSCEGGGISGPSNDVAAVSVSAPRSDIRVGQTIQLAASPVNNSGSIVTGQTISWTSDNNAVATVDGSGQVTGVGPGTAKITASAGEKSGSLTVSVSLVPISTIDVSAATSPLPAGVPVQLTVVAKDSANRVLSGRSFSFSSSNTNVATVSGTGVVTGKIPGGTLVTVSAEGKVGSATLNVVLGPPSSITINNGEVYVGVANQLTATLRDPAGNALSTSGFDWSSSDQQKVSVTSTGLIRGVAAGSAVITARASGITGTVNTRTVIVRTIDSGSFTTCFLDDQGIAYCFGRNSHNEAGIGGATAAVLASPVRVATNLRFTQLSVGSSHACGLVSDGSVYCWGANDRGALGDGTFVERSAPTPVNTALKFIQISAGHDHTCALVADGQAYCWGGVNYGPTPTAVTGSTLFTKITAGYSVTCGIDPSRQAWCFGNNDFRQMGTGDAIGSLTPRKVAVSVPFDQIQTTAFNTCARTASGDVWCWGTLGPSGGFPPPPNVPTKQSVPVPFFDMTVGGSHVCALDGSNTTYCWGISNNEGQQGNGTLVSKSVPTEISTIALGTSRFAKLGAGDANACGVSTDGVPYCWGRAETLGNVVNDNRTAPTPIRPP